MNTTQKQIFDYLETFLDNNPWIRFGQALAVLNIITYQDAGMPDDPFHVSDEKMLRRLKKFSRTPEVPPTQKISEAIRLLNSMVESGENHSPQSRAQVDSAMEALQSFDV